MTARLREVVELFPALREAGCWQCFAPDRPGVAGALRCVADLLEVAGPGRDPDSVAERIAPAVLRWARAALAGDACWALWVGTDPRMVVVVEDECGAVPQVEFAAERPVRPLPQGHVMCPDCGGSGRIEEVHGYWTPCGECGGAGTRMRDPDRDGMGG